MTTAAPPTRRDRPRLVLAQLLAHGPELLALSALALTQPLLDLFGTNPEFFVASQSSRAEIVGFALVVGFAVPVVGVLLESLVLLVAGPRAGSLVHHVLVGVLGAALGLAVATQLGLAGAASAVTVSVVVAVAVVLARWRFAGFRLVLRYLGLAPVAFVVLFLFTSESGDLLWQDEADAEAGVGVGNEAPVVMVMFDELPMASLLRADGTVNEARFPNFARLARQGTWYRNATSVSASTVRAVPAALSGRMPGEGGIPTSVDYPENLFTLLGERYQMDVSETLTDLCPSSVCRSEASPGAGDFVDHLSSRLTDAAVVYGHLVLPQDWRRDLPAVDQSWEGFLEGAEPEAFESVEVEPESAPVTGEDRFAFFDRMRERNPDAFAGIKGEALLRSIEEADFGSGRLFFSHESFPHFVWERTPEGGYYNGRSGPPGTRDGRWLEDGFLIRQGLQRHLLQVGYADAVLGRLIDRLEAEGLWDEALVVVTADHGYAFQAGAPTRQPTERTVHDIYRVPLMVKAPGQEQGGPDDRNAMLIDIVPTVIDLLDVDVDWDLDGRSLVGPPRPDDSPKPVVYSGPPEVPGGFEEAVRSAQRNALLLPFEGSWPSLARVGPYARLVGRPLRDLDVVGPAALSWTVEEADDLADYRPGARPIPLILHGTASAEGGDGPADGLLVVNGRVAGAVAFRPDGGDLDFSGLIDHSLLRPGENRVQVIVPEPGSGPRAWRVAVPA